MDSFIPTPPLGVQDEVAGPQNPQWLRGTANTIVRTQRGFPSQPYRNRQPLLHDTRPLRGDIAASAQAAAWRSVFAAATMCCSAGITSAHCRVFRPQSGLTHRWPAGMRSAAFCISDTTCAASGMFGE